MWQDISNRADSRVFDADILIKKIFTNFNRYSTDSYKFQQISLKNSKRASQIPTESPPGHRFQQIFHRIPQISMDSHRSSEILPDFTKSSKILNDSHRFQQILEDPQWFLQISLDSHRSSMIPTDLNRFSQILRDSPRFQYILKDPQWFPHI